VGGGGGGGNAPILFLRISFVSVSPRKSSDVKKLPHSEIVWQCSLDPLFGSNLHICENHNDIEVA